MAIANGIQFPTAFSPLCRPVSIGAAGDNEAIPAVEGLRIVIVSYQLTPESAVTITFKSGTGGGATAISGAILVAGDNQAPINGGGFNQAGWMATTVANQPFNIYLSDDVTVAGMVTYALVP